MHFLLLLVFLAAPSLSCPCTCGCGNNDEEQPEYDPDQREEVDIRNPDNPQVVGRPLRPEERYYVQTDPDLDIYQGNGQNGVVQGGEPGDGQRRRLQIVCDEPEEDASAVICHAISKFVSGNDKIKRMFEELGYDPDDHYGFKPSSELIDSVTSEIISDCREQAEQGNYVMNSCFLYVGLAKHFASTEALGQFWVDAYGNPEEHLFGCALVVNEVNAALESEDIAAGFEVKPFAGELVTEDEDGLFISDCALIESEDICDATEDFGACFWDENTSQCTEYTSEVSLGVSTYRLLMSQAIVGMTGTFLSAICRGFQMKRFEHLLPPAPILEGDGF